MKASRQLLRSARVAALRQPVISSRRLLLPSASSADVAPRRGVPIAPFSTSFTHFRGLQPDSSDPAPPKTEPSHGHASTAGAAQISDAEYHEISDQYLNTLVTALEELQERRTDGIEVEYSAGVLTVTHPQNGTYVINKQPPNRQIWLSSPVSGPKRYDWVLLAASQSHKEDSTIDSGDDGSTGGKWIYLRDGSSLSELLKKELGVELPHGALEAELQEAREGSAKPLAGEL